MKLIIGLVVLIQLVGLNGFTQNLPPHYCPNMSKDPKCWQTKPKLERPTPCPNKSFCGKVMKISHIQSGRYYCEANGLVDCTDLVKTYGYRLVGAPILITYQQVDGCHVPGICGPKACVAMYNSAVASLSPVCR